MDGEHFYLQSYSDRIIAALKSYLENAENIETFKQITNTLAAFARNYKQSFENNFCDIVDMIVGWHLENGQSLEVKEHCSVVLQHFSHYFLKNLEFTLSLVTQFLEDIQSFSNTENDEDPEPITLGTFSYLITYYP